MSLHCYGVSQLTFTLFCFFPLTKTHTCTLAAGFEDSSCCQAPHEGINCQVLASNSKIQSSLLLPCYLALSIFCLSSASILSESLLCSSTLCLTFPSASLKQAALNLVLSHYMCILPLSIHLCLSHCINEIQRSHDK